jgi:hypothetical protein
MQVLLTRINSNRFRWPLIATSCKSRLLSMQSLEWYHFHSYVLSRIPTSQFSLTSTKESTLDSEIRFLLRSYPRIIDFQWFMFISGRESEDEEHYILLLVLLGSIINHPMSSIEEGRLHLRMTVGHTRLIEVNAHSALHFTLSFAPNRGCSLKR